MSSVPQPQYFFRVQPESSFTQYEQENGFVSEATYYMDYPYWVNQGKIQSHLTWGDRPEQTTPFVSVFDDLGDAQKFAKKCSYMCHQHGHRDQCPQTRECSRGQQVRVVRIDASSLRPSMIDLKFKEGILGLPVWTGPDNAVFLSIKDARQVLKVDFRWGQNSEWFALHGIPFMLIKREEGRWFKGDYHGLGS